jgi:hypothetical protein
MLLQSRCGVFWHLSLRSDLALPHPLWKGDLAFFFLFRFTFILQVVSEGEKGINVQYMTISYSSTTFVGESYATDVVVTGKGSL